MRILHVVEAALAGVGRHVIDLARAQAGAGHDVHVAYWAARESSAFARERQGLGQVVWHRFPARSALAGGHVRSVVAVGRLIRQLTPAVIHTHSTKGGVLGRLAAARSAITSVYTPNGVYTLNPDLGRWRRRAVAAVERRLSTMTDLIIAVSPEEQAHLLEIGVAEERVVLIPNGITDIAPADRDEVRAQLALGVEAPTIGFVGRLEPQKRPLQLIDVFERVVAELPEAQLVVVGDGSLAAALARRVEALGQRGDQIHLVGPQPGTWAMAAFDVLLLPTVYEGFPYVLVEAAALGLPIVTTRAASVSLLAGGPAELHTVDAGDVTAMAASCVTVLGRQHDPGGGGRSPDRRFTVAAMAEAVEQAYQSVARPAGSSRFQPVAVAPSAGAVR